MESKVFIRTYGCSFNQLDSQIMGGKLIKDNFILTDDENEADLVVINSCSVKNLSEAKFFNDVKRLKNSGKKLILSGCITQAEESYLSTSLKGISVIGTNDLDKISFVAKNTLENNPIQIVSKLQRKPENEKIRLEKESMRLSNNKTNKNPLVEIVPINEGCLNTCSFCKTKQARGHLFSYSINSIVENIKNAVDNGAKEIYLTSQDTGCYGFDIGVTLCDLLNEILKIKGEFRIRIGMGNPNHFKKIIDEVLEIMKNDNRIYKFLHIPIQAGSNRILTEMRRLYELKDYRTIITKAKLAIPDITIANDIIVAYPTETEEEFEMTLNNIIGTNVLNFSRFWLRPNTPAQRMYSKKDFIEGSTSKKRAKILKEKFESQAIEYNKKWIGWSGQVLVTEEGKAGTNTFVCRNDYYKPIIIKKVKGVNIGDTINVQIKNVTWFDFRGEIL
jgi:threonylcarbamoyladenosine tRNA methylthiotransferase CDKAL1